MKIQKNNILKDLEKEKQRFETSEELMKEEFKQINKKEIKVEKIQLSEQKKKIVEEYV